MVDMATTTNGYVRGGAMLGVLVRLLADLSLIAIAVVLILCAGGAVHLHIS